MRSAFERDGMTIAGGFPKLEDAPHLLRHERHVAPANWRAFRQHKGSALPKSVKSGNLDAAYGGGRFYREDGKCKRDLVFTSCWESLAWLS